jgi:cobalt/nickel transport system permease protein
MAAARDSPVLDSYSCCCSLADASHASGAPELRHTVVEEWSRGSSVLHRRAPGVKLLTLAFFLVLLATAHRKLPLLAAGLCILLVCGILAAGLPFWGALSRAAAVLPFTGLFAIVSWLAGDPTRAVELILKSYLSTLAVLVLVGTTPLPELVYSLELIKVPRFLLTVVQFLYRYLFVVLSEAAHMRSAAAARGGMSFRAAAGALAVLFARSYSRAEGIHRAMAARGFDGRFHPLFVRSLSTADGQFAALSIGILLLLRAAVEVMR